MLVFIIFFVFPTFGTPISLVYHSFGKEIVGESFLNYEFDSEIIDSGSIFFFNSVGGNSSQVSFEWNDGASSGNHSLTGMMGYFPSVSSATNEVIVNNPFCSSIIGDVCFDYVYPFSSVSISNQYSFSKVSDETHINFCDDSVLLEMKLVSFMGDTIQNKNFDLYFLKKEEVPTIFDSSVLFHSKESWKENENSFSSVLSKISSSSSECIVSYLILQFEETISGTFEIEITISSSSSSDSSLGSIVSASAFGIVLLVFFFFLIGILCCLLVFAFVLCGLSVPSVIKQIQKQNRSEEEGEGEFGSSDEYEVYESEDELKENGPFLEEPKEEDYEKRRNKLKEDEICVVCLDRKRVMQFLPCGHYACCESCGISVVNTSSKCPLCRSEIEDFSINIAMKKKSKNMTEIEKEEKIIEKAEISNRM